MSDKQPNPDFILWNADDVAHALRVTPDSVRHMHRRGELPGKMCGGGLRWLPRIVREFGEALFEDGDDAS